MIPPAENKLPPDPRSQAPVSCDDLAAVADGARELRQNRFSASDVESVLLKKGWLASPSALAANGASDSALRAWLGRAADFLGPHAVHSSGDPAMEGNTLAELLALVFRYDAAAFLQRTESQSVMSRDGARDVIREVANRVLDGGEIDSGRLTEIVDRVKKSTPYRSREIFHPLRLALAGRAGDGELDRVILLIDSAAKINFAEPVKTCRQRMLEFCAALD